MIICSVLEPTPITMLVDVAGLYACTTTGVVELRVRERGNHGVELPIAKMLFVLSHTRPVEPPNAPRSLY